MKERDFIEAFDKLQSRNKTLRFKTVEIAKMVAGVPAPRFYVSVDEALMKYNLYKRGKLDVTRSLKIKMYEEIFRRYEEALAANDKTAFRYSIMQSVLNTQAPSFYMEPITAVDFYYRAMRNRRKNNRR